jgi:hypothetical protein
MSDPVWDVWRSGTPLDPKNPDFWQVLLAARLMQQRNAVSLLQGR